MASSLDFVDSKIPPKRDNRGESAQVRKGEEKSPARRLSLEDKIAKVMSDISVSSIKTSPIKGGISVPSTKVFTGSDKKDEVMVGNESTDTRHGYLAVTPPKMDSQERTNEADADPRLDDFSPDLASDEHRDCVSNDGEPPSCKSAKKSLPHRSRTLADPLAIPRDTVGERPAEDKRASEPLPSQHNSIISSVDSKTRLTPVDDGVPVLSPQPSDVLFVPPVITPVSPIPASPLPREIEEVKTLLTSPDITRLLVMDETPPVSPTSSSLVVSAPSTEQSIKHPESPLQDTKSLVKSDAAIDQLRADLAAVSSIDDCRFDIENDNKKSSVIKSISHISDEGLEGCDETESSLSPKKSLSPVVLNAATLESELSTNKTVDLHADLLKDTGGGKISSEGILSDEVCAETKGDTGAADENSVQPLISIERRDLCPNPSLDLSISRGLPEGELMGMDGDLPSSTSILSPARITETGESKSSQSTERKGSKRAMISDRELLNQKRALLLKSGVTEEWSLIRMQKQTPLSEWKTNEQCETPGLKRVVKCTVRIRPFTVGEKAMDSRRIVSSNGDKLILVNPSAFEADPDAIAAAALVTSHNQWAKEFRFDHCLWSYNPTDKDDIHVDQSEVFRITGLDMVEHVMKGGDVFCSAYGQTGAGKTYTLFGNLGDANTGNLFTHNNGLDVSQDFPITYGLVPRVFCDIVERILRHQELSSDTKITLSFVEIYNEKIRDLLSPMTNDVLNVRTRGKSGSAPSMDSFTKTEVMTSLEVLETLVLGLSRRTNTRRFENSSSSRSHALVMMELQPLVPQLQKHRSSNAVVRIQMVDLAGSESEIAKDGPEAKAAKSKELEIEKHETKQIKKSLSTLGYIIKELSRGVRPRGLPYRDSVLTWLLKETLSSSDSYINMISTISPSHTAFNETLNTLKYTHRLVRNSQKLKRRETSGGLDIRPSNILGGGPDNEPEPSEMESNVDLNNLLGNLGGKGTAAARDVLRHIISDPQQRIAKLNPREAPQKLDEVNVSLTGTRTTKSLSGNQSIEVEQLDSTALESKKKYDSRHESGEGRDSANQRSIEKKQISTGTYEPNFKEAYRVLQGQMVELRIELEGIRTDRDSLLLELQNARDTINTTASINTTDIQQAMKATDLLRETERKVTELKELVLRKDEKLDDLMGDVAHERGENAMLRHDVSKMHVDLEDRNIKIERVSQECKKMETMLQSLLEQNAKLKSDLDFHRNESVGLLARLESVEADSRSKIDDLSQQVVVLNLERDHIKSQQLTLTEDIVPLRQLVSSLEKELDDAREAAASQWSGEFLSLRSDLETLLTMEAEVAECISSCAVDEINLSTTLKELEAILGQKVLGWNGTISSRTPANDGLCTHLLNFLSSLRRASEKQSIAQLEVTRQLLEGSEVAPMMASTGNNFQSEMGLAQQKIMELEEVICQKDKEISLLNSEKMSLHRSIENRTSVEKNNDKDFNAVLQDANSVSQHEINLLKQKLSYSENVVRNLEQQLQARQQEPKVPSLVASPMSLQERRDSLRKKVNEASARKGTDLDMSRQDIEREYASLWIAVGELNKLDSEKEQAIADLLKDREDAFVERDMYKQRCEDLQEDISDIDKYLSEAIRDNSIEDLIEMPLLMRDLEDLSNNVCDGLRTNVKSKDNIKTKTLVRRFATKIS